MRQAWLDRARIVIICLTDIGWSDATLAQAGPVPAVQGMHKETHMRLLIALLLPWLTFFTIGRPFAGIICLILQITVIGWLPATIWAVYALSQYKTDQKIAEAMRRR